MAAEERFDRGAAEVRLLLDVCSTEVDLARRTDRDNAVHRACVVLLVSHFESFLKNLAEDFIDTIGTGTLESRDIPRGIRELHTLPKMAEILESGDEVQRGALLKKLPPLMALWNDQAKPASGTLKAATLSREVTSADHRTIDAVFSLMGLTESVCDGDLDVPDEDGELAPYNIRFGLTDVVKCRNDIAHGDDARKPTAADIDRYMRFLSSLAKRLQRKVDALAVLVLP